MDKTEFNANFLADMNQSLANHYWQWLPYCRSAVDETVNAIAKPEFLQHLYGHAIDETIYTDFQTVWFNPFNSYLQRSGKLLRPYIICFCIEAFGKNPKEQKIGVALAEIIHTASLIFDDIADDSVLRRGGMTAHQKIGIRVAGTGASAWLNICFELIHQNSKILTEEVANQLINEIAWEHWVTGIGTTIDVVWPWLQHYNYLPRQYLQSVVHRSTSYTYRLPFKMGAIMAGADPEQLKFFSMFGEELGLAFQIIDDILNLKPDDEHWGKQIAEDLTQGKITLQVLLALENSNTDQAKRLVEILQQKSSDLAILQEAIAIIEQTGAFEQAKEIAQHHVSSTKVIIEKMTFIPISFREKLSYFVDYIVNRKR